MKYVLLSLLATVSLSAQDYPTIKKYNGLFMPISEKSSTLYYFLIRGETYGENDRWKLTSRKLAAPTCPGQGNGMVANT